MSIIRLFHGSQVVVEKPLFGYGKKANDYGRGFYCTEHIELAKEWACPESKDGFVNEYELELDGLKVLNLSKSCNILNWLAILVENRNVNLNTALQIRAKEYLTKHFLINYEDYDVIIGNRADDSYFLFVRNFLSNQISLKQLSAAMKLGELKEQVFIQSQKAFSRIKFIKSTQVDSSKYYFLRKQRDEKARLDFLKVLEDDDIDGLFMRDIILEGVQNDDPRI